MIYFSKSTNGFYDSDFNSVIPNDAVEITKEYHLSLLDAQSTGKCIVADSRGRPITKDAPKIIKKDKTQKEHELQRKLTPELLMKCILKDSKSLAELEKINTALEKLKKEK